MFHAHPSFIAPVNINAKIWKYIDISKFLSLIENESLFFVRADKLPDQFEGSYTKKAFIARSTAGIDYPKWYMNLRTKMLINCWHMNEYESDAMWRIYLKSNEGVAIQTTYDRLIDSISRDIDYYTHVGLVNYLDFEKDFFSPGNACNAFLTKLKCFEYEKELRAIVDLSTWNPGTNSHKETVEHGKNIPIHLNNLIENVYVSPYCEDWIFDLLNKILVRYELNFKICRSSLNTQPIY